MPTFLLLTGAGFSRNWGGPLVSEVFNNLIATPGLTQRVREMLWKAEDGGGYEEVLDRLQTSSDPQDREDLKVLDTAILSMFNHLKTSMKARDLDFTNDMQRTVTAFLGKFHVIFTLNQDVFLETKYTPYIGTWQGRVRPGVVQFQDGLWGPQEPFEMPPPRIQPYVKLHGSMDFRTTADGSGAPLLIAGGRKEAAIKAQPLLWSYRKVFDDYISRPDARLMVIGYGFHDPHINDALDAAVKNGLKFFVIDPLGGRVLDARGNKPGAIPILKEPRQERFETALMGASKRLLSEIFGNDMVEWTNVMRFFEV